VPDLLGEPVRLGDVEGEGVAEVLALALWLGDDDELGVFEGVPDTDCDAEEVTDGVAVPLALELWLADEVRLAVGDCDADGEPLRVLDWDAEPVREGVELPLRVDAGLAVRDPLLLRVADCVFVWLLVPVREGL
jgi:hypothetical protein